MKKRSRSLLNLALCVCFLLFTAAKCVRVTVSPENPKQGDNVNFVITANESSSLTKVDYTIGSNTGSTAVVPKTITVNTCKSTGVYYTTISYSAKAYYKDGTIKSTSGSIDLTVGKNIREDTDKTYVTYIADEGDGTINDVRSGWANAFQDEFDTYTETQYYWSQPAFFTTSSLYYVNSADMAIFLGHGSPHQYRAGPNGSDWVDFTNASYGMFAPCFQVGDLEYLVTGSCQVLSMADIGTNGWRFFWRHTNSTKNNDRVFTGLHLVCGFRTNHHYDYWWWFGWHSSSTDFFEQFAESLDDGATIRDAWLDSAGDNLSFDDGNNRTAVFYLPCYENDRISSYTSDDYIFGNSNYYLWAEYWE